MQTQLTFWILDIANALKPTPTLTYADLHMGIPSMLSCIEMVPICLLMAWAYPLSPYLLRRGRPPAAERGRATVDYPRSYYQGGPLSVWGLLAMLSPREHIEGLVFAFRADILAQRVGGLCGCQWWYYCQLGF